MLNVVEGTIHTYLFPDNVTLIHGCSLVLQFTGRTILHVPLFRQLENFFESPLPSTHICIWRFAMSSNTPIRVIGDDIQAKVCRYLIMIFGFSVPLFKAGERKYYDALPNFITMNSLILVSFLWSPLHWGQCKIIKTYSHHFQVLLVVPFDTESSLAVVYCPWYDNDNKIMCVKTPSTNLAKVTTRSLLSFLFERD